MESNDEEFTKKDKIILFLIKLPIILLLIGFSIYSYLYVRDIMTFYFLLGMWVFFLVTFITFGISKYGGFSGYSMLGAIFYVIGLFAFDITIVAKYLMPWGPIVYLIILHIPYVFFIRELKNTNS